MFTAAPGAMLRLLKAAEHFLLSCMQTFCDDCTNTLHRCPCQSENLINFVAMMKIFLHKQDRNPTKAHNCILLIRAWKTNTALATETAVMLN